jgi:hypothetical protein
MNLLGELDQTITFGIIFSRVDKRVSALHGTILAALLNFTGFIHKTWIFYAIESFGIFYPQFMLGIVGMLIILKQRTSFLALGDSPKQAWHVSDQTLKSQSKAQ